MKISTVLKFVLLTMFLPLVTMRAQSVVYSGNFTSPYAALQDIGVSWSTFSTATVGVQVAVDPNALRLSFQKFQLETPSFSLTKTVSISAGFGGATKNDSVALNFNALTFVMSDGIASHSLSAGTGGNYSISGTTDLLHPIESLVLTGSYTIVGPTTTVTNAFSVQAAGTTYLRAPTTLNTTNYPSSLTLSRTDIYTFTNEYYFTSGQTNVNFVNASVDGEQITWAFGSFAFGGTLATLSPGSLAASAVPEPATYAAIFGVTALGFAAYRRRNKSV